MFVLFVEHNPERQRVVAASFDAAAHRVETLGSASEALIRLAGPGHPDLVLVEDRLPDMDVEEFLRAIGRMELGVHVVVYGEEERAEGWIEATTRGLLDYVRVDDRGAWLEALSERVEGAVRRAAEANRARRLAAALDSTAAAVLLVNRAGRARYANDAASRLLGRTPSELGERELHEFVDFGDDVGNRTRVFRALETDGEWAGEVDALRSDGERVPALATLSPIRRGGRGGSQGFVLTLRDVSERVGMEEALRAANRRLAEQAARDPLTGLYNRRYFREVLDREGARNCRYGEPLTVLMSDLDRFKEVNDQFGHDAGDRVLLGVASTLPDGLREGDIVARLGGDEFCVILPNTAEAAARLVSERVLEDVRARGRAGEATIPLDMSIGLATSPSVIGGPCIPPSELLRRADMALLAAKRAGGGRAVAYSELDLPPDAP